MCNSRRHRQCPASRKSVKHTPGARKTVLQGVRLHNSDYVKEAPASRCEGPTFELPGEAASDKQPPSGATRAPARRGAAHFALASRERQCQNPRAQSAAPWNRHQDSKGSVSLETSVPCKQSSALGASLRVVTEPKAVCRNKSATPPSSPFLRGTASPCYTCPLFLHTLRPFHRCTGLADASGRTRFQGHKVFRAGRGQPSRLLAQRMPVSQRTRCQAITPSFRRKNFKGHTPGIVIPRSSPPPSPATVPRRPSSTAPVATLQRSRVGTSPRRTVPVRGNRHTPLHRHLTLTHLGRSGPGP